MRVLSMSLDGNFGKLPKLLDNKEYYSLFKVQSRSPSWNEILLLEMVINYLIIRNLPAHKASAPCPEIGSSWNFRREGVRSSRPLSLVVSCPLQLEDGYWVDCTAICSLCQMAGRTASLPGGSETLIFGHHVTLSRAGASQGGCSFCHQFLDAGLSLLLSLTPLDRTLDDHRPASSLAGSPHTHFLVPHRSFLTHQILGKHAHLN